MSYIAFRRGNWPLLIASCFVPGAWMARGTWCRTLIQSVGSPSWMSCGLMFTQPCTRDRGKCAMCQVSQDKKHSRTYHTLTVTANGEQDGVLTLVDAPFENPDAWLFVKVPDIKGGDAFKFWKSTQVADATYNRRGLVFNFMPAWMRLCSGPRGVQADNDISRSQSFFCSEMICAFLQTHGYPMGLTPCTTTPQMLLASLIKTHPQLQQLVLGPEPDGGKLLSKNLVAVPAASV